MKKKERLYRKIMRLWKQAGLPAYLHRFGPKKYKSVFLAFCWFVNQQWAHSLRRTQELLFELGFPVPHWTTIQKASARMSRILSLFHKLTVSSEKSYICAVDSTGFSLTNPSRYYTNIFQVKVSCPAKLSVLVDTRTSKALALCFRARPAHDARDVPYLLKNAAVLPEKIVGDSAYDAEDNVFKPCFNKHIAAIVQAEKRLGTWFLSS